MSELNNDENRLKRESAEESLKKLTEELEELSVNYDPSQGRARDGWTEDNYEQEMAKHPFFSTDPNIGYESSPLLDAMRQLKYDEQFNSKEDLVKSYKDDGNENFKRKKYRWAVESYSKAIEIGCEDPKLNSIVYNNRASAQFHLGNHRSSLNDAIKAFELDSDNTKALNRIVFCYFELKDYRNCIEFCKTNREKSFDLLTEYEKKASLELKKAERNERKEKLEANKRRNAELIIAQTVEKRGIKYVGSLFESIHPAAGGKHVTLDPSKQLVWPVLFLYPEYGQSDFIESFEENQTFSDHLNVMFEEFPEWDIKRKYKPKDIIIGFNSFKTNEIKTFDSSLSLKDILTDVDFVLESAIPTFILTCGEIRVI